MKKLLCVALSALSLLMLSACQLDAGNGPFGFSFASDFLDCNPDNRISWRDDCE